MRITLSPQIKSQSHFERNWFYRRPAWFGRNLLVAIKSATFSAVVFFPSRTRTHKFIMNSHEQLEDIGELCSFYRIPAAESFYRIPDAESLPLYRMIVKLACVFYSSDINFFAANFRLYFGQLVEQFVLSCNLGLWLILRIVASSLGQPWTSDFLHFYTSQFRLESLFPWLEFSSLSLSGRKYVFLHALVVPSAPNKGLQDYFLKLVSRFSPLAEKKR